MAETSKEKGLGCLLLLALLPFTIALRGFVLSKLWFYFIVPLGMNPIGLAHAYGLSILVQLFSGHYVKSEEMKDGEMGDLLTKFVGNAIALPLFMWFMGWFFYCFMN
jgi:hypothetical protein